MIWNEGSLDMSLSRGDEVEAGMAIYHFDRYIRFQGLDRDSIYSKLGIKTCYVDAACERDVVAIEKVRKDRQEKNIFCILKREFQHNNSRS